MKKAKPKALSYWLMKSEPDVFSIETLQAKKRSLWDGVRNYQARNYMMKDMQIDDLIVFYHSSTTPPGVAGLAKVSALAQPDPTQWEKASPYFEPRASKEKPVWFCVEVEHVSTFKKLITLEQIKQEPSLKELIILKKGNRLSITPLTKNEYSILLALSKKV